MQPSPSDWRPPDPPQPLLKYHLIRHSYPATEEEADYEIPAFLPGPPYLQQQSRPLAPKIRHHKRKKHHSRSVSYALHWLSDSLNFVLVRLCLDYFSIIDLLLLRLSFGATFLLCSHGIHTIDFVKALC